MADEEQNRSEKASHYKLEQARKRGIVPKSPDLVGAGILLALAFYLYWLGWSGAKAQLRLAQATLSQAGRLDFSFAAMFAFVTRLLAECLYALLPLFLTLMIVGVVVNLAQTGPVFSLKPISPDFDRINPAKGFKRLFSLHVLYTLAKSLFKLFLLGSVFVMVVHSLLVPMLGLLDADARDYPRRLLDVAASLAFKLALVIFVLALVDVVYVRWEFGKRMLMSRREMREEHKHREGDPRVRARLRQMRSELLKRSRALKKLPGSDVLITNPTHVAVAISYKHGEMPAPKLVAKGAGGLARKMREFASRRRIPVVEHPVLARALFHKVDYDQFLPEEFYPQVLKILVWVYAMREARAQGAAA